MKGKSENNPILLPLKIAFIYACFSSLWILLSDQILYVLVEKPSLMIQIQMVKGWIFVIISALIIFSLLSTEMRRYLKKEGELRKSETNFRILAETSPVAISILRPDRLLYVNASWEKLTGYSKEESQTLDPIKIVHPEMRDKVLKRAAERMANKSVNQRYEIKGISKNGEIIWYDFSGDLIQFDGETAILCTMPDLTDRKKSEKERENLIHKLQQAIKEIKTLKGIIPVCAKCKNIRDDKGYWTKIESYIQKHSEAEFSHGMCPECSEKLYGDKEWYINMKKKDYCSSP